MYKLALFVILGVIASGNSIEFTEIGNIIPDNITCERGIMYYNECRVCNCNLEGVLECTRDFCTAPHTIRKNVKSCEPGTSFQADCKTCICMQSGTNILCTLKTCLPLTKTRVTREVYCTPGSDIMIGCNPGKCADDGKTALCILRECQPSDTIIRRKRDAGAQRCDPGSHFMQDCNTCICSIDGIVAHASCTINLCRNRRAIHRCEPGSVIHSDCNICTCAANGKMFSCTNNDCRS